MTEHQPDTDLSPDVIRELDAQTAFNLVLAKFREGSVTVRIEHSDARFLNMVRQKLRGILTREQFYSVFYYLTDEEGDYPQQLWSGFPNDRAQQAIQ